MSSRVTPRVRLFTLRCPVAAMCESVAAEVIPPAHTPIQFTSALPVIARQASTACSSASA